MASKAAKINVFEIFSSGGSPKETWSEEFKKKTVGMVLVFKVNVQQPKVPQRLKSMCFEIFS